MNPTELKRRLPSPVAIERARQRRRGRIEQILVAIEVHGVGAIYADDYRANLREFFWRDRPAFDEVCAELEAKGMPREETEDLVRGDESAAAELAEGCKDVAAINDAGIPRDVPGTGRPKLKPYNFSEFLNLSIPPREMILSPILPEKGTAMLFASRGAGKTHVAHGIACAVAGGGRFLRWQAPKARRVLCLDGEMPASELQQRLNWAVAGSQPKPDPLMLQLLPSDLVDGGVGNLASPKIQAALDPWLKEIDLLILDNLSSLTTVIRDNDAESSSPIQEWLLRLRRQGVSVLIVHHAGKGGEQRGTSRREDVLDTSISLRRPGDYVSTEGARFEVHIEKGRGIHGADAKPFEARLEVRDGVALWSMREIEDVNLARVAALLDDGLSIRDIADETGIKKSTVHNLKKKLEAEKGQANAGT
jgi:putative DNA primase/helicase